jgi:O-antigen/teichoic acid export membrane protein
VGGEVAGGGVRAYVARSAAVCMAGLLLNQALGQAAGALLARIVPDPRLYGELSLLLQYLSLAALGLGLGLDSALVYDLATGRPESGRSYAAAVRGMVLLAALPALVCTAAAPLLGRADHVRGFAPAVALGCATLFAQAALNASTAAQSGLRRFGAQMGLMVAATALAGAGRLLAVPLVARGASPGVVALAGAVGITAAAVGGARMASRLRLPGGASGVGTGRSGRADSGWTAELPRMLRYGWPLWAGNLLKAFQQPYLVLVAGGIGVTAAGLVSNDVALIGWAFLVTWAFRLVAVPLVASAGSGPERRARVALCFRLNHLVLFPIVALLIFWARPIVVAVYGARYAQAASLLPLLVLGVYGSSVGRLATDALAAVDRSRESVPIMLISSLPFLVGAPLAAAQGTAWLGALYCAGWLASGAYAYVLLGRIGLAVDPRAAFAEPLLPTACALPLALWGAHAGGPLGPAALAAAALLLAALTWAVYRADPPALRAAGTPPLPQPRMISAQARGT